LQSVHDAIRNSGLVSASISTMIAEAKLDIIKIPGLTNSLATTEGTTKIFNRFSNSMAAKSVINTLLLDKDEEWERKEIHVAGMDKVMQMYLMIVCGAADIPATRLLGKSPDGMNASGDSDSRNYYDRLSSDQVVRLTPALSPLDEVLIRHTFGTRDPKITYKWNSLWQESDDVKAGTALKKSQSFQIDVNSAIMDPEVLKRGREAQLIADDIYPGLDIAIKETGDKDHADIVPEEDNPEDDVAHQKALELIKAKGEATAAGKSSDNSD
jgi:phage-related protein (TIGR01555 family)